MKRPVILVVDDQFGGSILQRRNLCKAYRLLDVTGDDDSPLAVREPVAEAVFCSGQRQLPDRVENSQSLVLELARSRWPSSEGACWALCLLDLRFVSGEKDADGEPLGADGDDDFGLAILREFRRHIPELPVIILSSRERSEVIQECRELGASDFIQRHATPGIPPHELLVQKLHTFGLLEDTRGLIVGRSIRLLLALAAARRAATGSGNILLLGESGSGKELLARYIHDHGPRPKGPYKVFDAFGTAESLQEDLLFGHERGAFTGADRERRGLFEEADGGTLFIDEIGNISEPLQNRLLRPIESRSVMRQGSTREIAVALQLVLATNKPLDGIARTGGFKFDLLNRINAFTLHLPPLRERREDIPLVAEDLLQRLCTYNGLRWPRYIEEQAMLRLVKHDWRDGNVRELRNTLERAVKNHRDAELLVVSDLSFVRAATDDERTEVSDGDSGSSAAGADAVQPASYDALFGSWSRLQRNVATEMCLRLVAALQTTARRDASSGTPRCNLAGAVGCLLGRKVTTLEAADFVKRIVRFDSQVATRLAEQHTLLAEAMDLCFRSRPATNPRLSANKERKNE